MGQRPSSSGSWTGRWVVALAAAQALTVGHLAFSSPGFPLPLMGFNTCNVGCGNISFPNEEFVLQTAASMVQPRGLAPDHYWGSLRAAGWQYLNLDDGWADAPSGTVIKF
jgi:hypothetical protein